jgi:hypothetical protein
MSTRKKHTRKNRRPELLTTVLLGTYKLGDWHVDLYADFSSDGGSFNFAPSKDRLPTLIVGCDWDWHNVAGILVHEVLEFVLTMEQRRYRLADSWGQNHADYIFHFDHQHFTRASDMLGHFLVDVLPELAHAYNARNRELKRRGEKELGKQPR